MSSVPDGLERGIYEGARVVVRAAPILSKLPIDTPEWRIDGDLVQYEIHEDGIVHLTIMPPEDEETVAKRQGTATENAPTVPRENGRGRKRGSPSHVSVSSDEQIPVDTRRARKLPREDNPKCAAIPTYQPAVVPVRKDKGNDVDDVLAYDTMLATATPMSMGYKLDAFSASMPDCSVASSPTISMDAFSDASSGAVDPASASKDMRREPRQSDNCAVRDNNVPTDHPDEVISKGFHTPHPDDSIGFMLFGMSDNVEMRHSDSICKEMKFSRDSAHPDASICKENNIAFPAKRRERLVPPHDDDDITPTPQGFRKNRSHHSRR